jgi:hypothetical protein
MEGKMFVGSSPNTDISIQIIHTTASIATASTSAASTDHIVQAH